MKRLKNLHPAWLAVAISLGVVLWLASGMLAGSEKPAQTQQAGDDNGPGLVKVKIQTSRAQPVTREAEVSGRTAPVRSVTIRAETSGKVQSVAAERGAMLERGEIIVRLSQDDRQAQLRQAKALREQRRLQYKAAQRLAKKGYQTKLDLAQAKANLEAAQADVERIDEDLGDTVIRAPFAGVLETRPVEQGDFVATGDEIGQVIDQDPFIVRGSVSEDVIGYLETGQSGSVELVDGQTREGSIRYLASQADEQTRTYTVELKVPNPDGRLIAGASAKMRLPLEQVSAHRVEPATLTLNEAGDFGIKAVDDSNRVHFHAADIVRNRGGVVWLGGLPESLRIITVGQGFVTDGDLVDPTRDSDAIEPAAREAAGDAANLPDARP